MFHFSLLTDELIKDVQIGCHYSFVILQSCEIHECSGQFLCTPVFEVKCLKLWLEVFAFARFILCLKNEHMYTHKFYEKPSVINQCFILISCCTFILFCLFVLEDCRYDLTNKCLNAFAGK